MIKVNVCIFAASLADASSIFYKENNTRAGEECKLAANSRNPEISPAFVARVTRRYTMQRWRKRDNRRWYAIRRQSCTRGLSLSLSLRACTASREFGLRGNQSATTGPVKGFPLSNNIPFSFTTRRALIVFHRARAFRPGLSQALLQTRILLPSPIIKLSSCVRGCGSFVSFRVSSVFSSALISQSRSRLSEINAIPFFLRAGKLIFPRFLYHEGKYVLNCAQRI